MDPAKLQALAADIKMVGRLIHKINVRPRRPDDVYPPDYKIAEKRGLPIEEPWILVTGGRRTAAHYILGWPEIEAENFEDLDPLNQRIVELSENLNREDISWTDEVAAKAEIHALRSQQNPEQTLTKTAEELGEDKSNLSRDLKLVKAIEADPELAKAPTKKAAIRKMEFKAEISRRVAAVKAVDLGSLQARLKTQDMRDFVRQLETQSVDLHFTDFPFGIDYDQTSGNQDMTRQGMYRDDPNVVRDLLSDVVPHMVRTVKPRGWIAAMMGYTNHFYLMKLFTGACGTHCGYALVKWNEDDGTWKRESSECLHTTREFKTAEPCRFLTPEVLPWIWYRPNSRQPSLWPELHANNQYEMIVVVNGGDAKLVRPNVGNVLAIDAVYTDRIHEMQRPHAFCKEVISRLTVTGELVVDLCFGSGAHLAAAADLARDFRGCDINPANMGPALSLVSQHWRGQAVATAVQAGRAGAAQTVAENAAADEEFTDEEAASLLE